MENKQYLNIEFYGDMKWLEADYINQLKKYSLTIINKTISIQHADIYCDDNTVEGKVIMTNNDTVKFKGNSQSQTLKINNEKININTDTDFILNLIFSEYTKYIYSKLNL